MAKDYIDEMQKDAKLRFGKELSPAEVAKKFALHGFEARIQHLRSLEEQNDPVNSQNPTNMKRAANRLALERALKDTHERLRKIDR